jgi:hypothetical protein
VLNVWLCLDGSGKRGQDREGREDWVVLAYDEEYGPAAFRGLQLSD